MGATDSTEAAGLPVPRPLLDWLLGEARLCRGVPQLLDGFATRLVQGGMPLWRATYIVQTLHPLDAVAFYQWYEDRDGVVEGRRPHGARQASAYQNSPVRLVFEEGRALRRRLEGPAARLDYPILEELRADGCTDYLLVPVPFSDGVFNAFTLASRAPGGFAEDALAGAEAGLRLLGPWLEIQQRRALAATLLDTYLGHHTGERVLEGAITRGSGETIRAVIWFCDLRGFTPLSERLPRDFLIWVLNDYFEAVGGALAAEGGEILKFVGDAILAIFPLPAGADVTATCGRVMAAAQAAAQAMAALNERRAGEGKPALDYGVALHIGDVIYGNVGTPERLDFTVIGPAVNMVTRMEGLNGSLGHRLVASEAFATAAGDGFDCIGRFPFKGIAGEQAVYVPAG